MQSLAPGAKRDLTRHKDYDIPVEPPIKEDVMGRDNDQEPTTSLKSEE